MSNTGANIDTKIDIEETCKDSGGKYIGRPRELSIYARLF